MPASHNDNQHSSHRYDAFMSYSHKADAQLAKALENHLEKFAKPWYRLRSANIFRDETSLTATPHLWATIVPNLNESAYLIVLCSSTAAESKWVCKEICHWITDGVCDRPDRLQPSQVQLDRVERILLVLTEGEITWDDAEVDFDWLRSTALPKVALAGVFRGEPLWVDLRWARNTEKKLDRTNEEFMHAVAKLSAPIRNLDIESLVGTDYREHRRTLSLFRWLSFGLAMCFLVAVIASLVAWHQRGVALDALLKEQQERRLATAREFVAKADSLKDSSPDTAGLLSLHANQLFEGTDQPVPFFAQSSLLNSLESISGRGLGLDDGTVQVVRLANDKIYLAGVVSNQFRVRNASSDQLESLLTIALPPIENPSLSFEPRIFSFSPDENWLAVLGHSPKQELCMVNMAKRSAHSVLYSMPQQSVDNSDLNPPSHPVFSRDSSTLYFVDRSCHLHAFSFERAGKWEHSYTTDLFHKTEENRSLRDVEYAFVNGEVLVFLDHSAASNQIKWVPLNRHDKQLRTLETLDGADNAIQVRAVGNVLYRWELNGRIPLAAWKFDSDTSQFVERQIDAASLPVDRRKARVVAISHTGDRFVGTSSTGDAFVYSFGQGSVSELLRFPNRCSFLGDSCVLTTKINTASPESESVVQLWWLDDGKGGDGPQTILAEKGFWTVIPDDTGKHFALTQISKSTAKMIVVDVKSDGTVVPHEPVPFHLRHHSPDFTLLSDGTRRNPSLEREEANIYDVSDASESSWICERNGSSHDRAQRSDLPEGNKDRSD